ncbi:MAG TPA: GAF domain-containing protein [Catalimonadaceae bacterium]|nr:GAF domain-containing protein [Catalimonadaceae bacterium]
MEVLQVSGGTKEEKYIGLASQLQSLWSGEPDLTANLANTAAAMRQTFPFHWIGFYVVKANELVLGPFQGPVACTRIGLGRGVCGTAWKTKTTQLVPDVDAFPGHIACSSFSRSEIVVPILVGEEVVAVLDIDSSELNDFGMTDQVHLEAICESIARIWNP